MLIVVHHFMVSCKTCHQTWLLRGFHVFPMSSIYMIIRASTLPPRHRAPSRRSLPNSLPRVVQLTDRLFIFPHGKSTPGGHWLDTLTTSLPAQAYGIVVHDRMLLLDAVWPDTLHAALHTCATHALTPAALVVTHSHFLPIRHPAWHACLAQFPHPPTLLALLSVAAAANSHPSHVARFHNLKSCLPHEFGLRVLCWQGHSGADALLLWDAGDQGLVLFPGDCATGPSLLGEAQEDDFVYGSEAFFRHMTVSANLTRCVVLTFVACAITDTGVQASVFPERGRRAAEA